MDFFSRCQFLLPTLVSLLFSLDLLGASIDFESRFDLYDKLNQVVQTEGVERIKFMGHYLGLSGELEGIKLTGAPSSSRLPSLSLACALWAFGTYEFFPLLSLGEENRESLERALIFVFYKPSAEEIVRHIQTRPITFVPTGWIGHRVTIAFCGDYMALCNRGGHPERPSLEVFRIDLEKVTPQIIKTILEQESLGPMESGPFLYRTLPSLLLIARSRIAFVSIWLRSDRNLKRQVFVPLLHQKDRRKNQAPQKLLFLFLAQLTRRSC